VSSSTVRQRLESFRTRPLWFACADSLAVLLGALLPWSTSIFLILLIPFLLIVCVSVDVDAFRRSFSRAPSLVSVGFLILAVAGMFWSEATWSDGSRALESVVKFLALPFFLYYFQLSKRSMWVFRSFFLSCTLLMIYSWVVTIEPSWALKTGRCCGQDYGVPVRNYIDQGQEFGACLVALISVGLYGLKEREWKISVALCIATLLFAANLVFVVTSRTALVCIPVMLGVVAWRHARVRGLLTATGFGGVILAIAWFTSPHLRERVLSVHEQFLEYRDSDIPSSVGKRLEFWSKSIRFFREAPVFGHGTGSIHGLFEQDAVGRSGTSAEIIANPHNQTFSVAVQWGVLGLVALYALWFVHLGMFLREGFIAELGLLVIVQNMVGSLFNSHLFDFAEGWLYVLGVGVAGGLVARHVNKDSNQIAE